MQQELIDIKEDKELLSTFTLSNNLTERSELAQEIISNKPEFMEKWALLIFFVLLLIMVASTWFIKYPDIIETRVILTAQNAPKEILAVQDGRLVKLFVHNKDLVSVNQPIGWIESTAKHAEVMELSRRIEITILRLSTNKAIAVAGIFDEHYHNLGEIQPAYQQFVTALQLYNDYMVNGFYARKRKLLNNEINSLNSKTLIIQSQRNLVEKDEKLAEESYNMNKKLLDENVLTKEEFRTQTSKYVNKQLAIPQLNNTLLDNETQKRDKLNEIDQVDHAWGQQKVIFSQTLQSLRSQVDDWIKKHVLLSPINGRVFFIIPLQENQFIQAGKLLGYINPAENHYYAQGNLSQLNFGKLDTGLSVQLRFDAYPYQESGFVEGKLNYISEIPSDSGFMATIKLNNGLMTNNHKLIPYKNGLKAQAIIITKNMRLLERLYYKAVKSTSVGNR